MSAVGRLSIPLKLSLLATAASTLGLLLAGAGFFLYEQLLYRRDMVREIDITARIIGRNGVAALAYDDPRSAGETLETVRVDSRIVSAALYDRAGLLFATYRRDRTRAASPGRVPPGDGESFDTGDLTLHREILLGGERVGAVLIQADMSEMRVRLESYGAITMALILLSGFGTFLASLFLRRIVSRPILELARTARSVSGEKNYSLRASGDGDDEIGVLVRSFNEMLEQIQKRDQELQAAHDELEIRVSSRTRELRDEISDRISIEKELRRSEMRFRSVAYSASDAIVSADAGGRILSWSQGASRMFGWEEAEVLGREIVILMPERYRDLHRHGMRRFLETGEAHVIGKAVEMDGVRKNGEEFPIELSVASWTTEEGVFFSGIIRDNTERKRAEREILLLNAELEVRVKRRTAQLEAANRDLQAFSYSVSHDLRAPLQSIDGFSQALVEDYGDRLEGEGLDYLRRVRAASQRMDKLIDDMLTLSRIGRGVLHRERANLGELAQKAAIGLRSRDPGRDVTFVIEPDVPTSGDRNLLRILIDTLMSNAWKFTSKHETARIEFGVRRGDGEPVFFVKDDGAGFEMAYVGKLFGAFQRLHSSTEFPGTGIGLATVQRIVHRHGGRVWAEGEVEKGATFFFTLPEGDVL